MAIKAAADYLAAKDYLDTNPFVNITPSDDSESLKVGRAHNNILSTEDARTIIRNIAARVNREVLKQMATALNTVNHKLGLMHTHANVADPYVGFVGDNFDPEYFQINLSNAYPVAADPGKLNTTREVALPDVFRGVLGRTHDDHHFGEPLVAADPSHVADSVRAALPDSYLDQDGDLYSLYNRFIDSADLGPESKGTTFMDMVEALYLGGNSKETNLAKLGKGNLFNLLSPTLNAIPTMDSYLYNQTLKFLIPELLDNNLPLSPTDTTTTPVSPDELLARRVPGDGRTVGQIIAQDFSDQFSKGDESNDSEE